MKCKICKKNIATQIELITVGKDSYPDIKTSEINVVFAPLCKECSLSVLCYDQETIDMYLKYIKDEKKETDKVNIFGKDYSFFDLS